MRWPSASSWPPTASAGSWSAPCRAIRGRRLRRAVAQAVRRAVRPNLAYDDAETRRRQDEKRAAVKEAVLQIRRGERIIEAGEPITKTHLLIFQAMRAAGRAASDEQVRWGGALFAALICFALYVFARR